MNAVALSARELADLLLLIRPLEVEPADIGAGRHLAGAKLDHVAAAGDLLEHRLLAVERIARLIDIAELHRVADADTAVVRRLLADDHAEERGLAGAVRADHADDAAWRQLEGEIVDEEAVAEAFADILRLDDHIAEARSRRNGDLRLAVGVAAGLRHQLVIGLDTRLGLCLARLGACPDPVELAGERPLFRRILLAFNLEPLVLLLEPGGIAAVIGNAGTAIELESPFGDVVEEVAVVGDHDHGAWIIAQMMLEPGHAFGVEMVGRLIEQKDVGFGEQQ